MKRHRGFTIIELIVAIAVIMILAGILFFGARSMTNSTKKNTTISMLQNMQSMTGERGRAIGAKALRDEMNNICVKANTPLAQVYNTGARLKSVEPGSDERYPEMPYATGAVPSSNNAVGATQYFMALLVSQPANKSIVANLPKRQFLEKKEGLTADYTPPVLLDGYGNPIILVPTDGLDVAFDDGTTRTISAPTRLPFFASAGLDGNFRTGDDNLYSFEN